LKKSVKEIRLKKKVEAMTNRKFFVGGNWKMNTLKSSALEIVQRLNSITLNPSVEVVVAPPTIYICLVRDQLRKEIAVSAQNLYEKSQGAFTGEISADQILDCGASWVIVGHSERRSILTEDDSFIARKCAYALKEGLKVILCIGEDLATREAGKTIPWVVSQLEAVSDAINDWSKVVIAYEPIWAIGTGKVATTQQAQEVHAEIRKWLAGKLGQEVAESTRIIYGGSVAAKNAKELSQAPDIDGFLVGGASLKPEFVDILSV